MSGGFFWLYRAERQCRDLGTQGNERNEAGRLQLTRSRPPYKPRGMWGSSVYRHFVGLASSRAGVRIQEVYRWLSAKGLLEAVRE